jgi:hypothetical protein
MLVDVDYRQIIAKRYNPGAFHCGPQSARSVLECASPLALSHAQDANEQIKTSSAQSHF